MLKCFVKTRVSGRLTTFGWLSWLCACLPCGLSKFDFKRESWITFNLLLILISPEDEKMEDEGTYSVQYRYLYDADYSQLAVFPLGGTKKDLTLVSVFKKRNTNQKDSNSAMQTAVCVYM